MSQPRRDSQTDLGKRVRQACLAISTLLAIAAAPICNAMPIASAWNWGPNQAPWFTGPLLTPSAAVVTGGNFNLEPYLYVDSIFGSYDSSGHTQSEPHFTQVNMQVSIQLGLNRWMDLVIIPQMYWNHVDGAKSLEMGDTVMGFDFQLLSASYSNWAPNIKLAIRESIPTGNYQNLNASKNGTDASGTGSYSTTAGLVFSRLFHLYRTHFLSVRFSSSFTYHAPTFVHELNTYGGGTSTRGWIYPGNTYLLLLGLEYNLTKHWALAMDVAALWNNKTRFSGEKGFVAGTNLPASVVRRFGKFFNLTESSIGSSSSRQFSLAPAVEYLFNPSVGMIAGVWFTIAGRNTSQFANGVVALNYYY